MSRRKAAGAKGRGDGKAKLIKGEFVALKGNILRRDYPDEQIIAALCAHFGGDGAKSRGGWEKVFHAIILACNYMKGEQ